MKTSFGLAALAVLIAIGSPALAQETGGGPPGPGSRYGLVPNASSTYDYGYRSGGSYDPSYRDRAYYHDRAYRRDYGFNPFDAAAGAVGGAVGTSGAIATAPFRAFSGSDSYAMTQGDSYCAERYRSYDPASGTFMGYDGRRHPCP